MTTRQPAPSRRQVPTRNSDGFDLLHRRYVAGRADREAIWEEVCANAQVARTVRGLRESAGMTQRQLARLIGTTASVVCRLEDEEYQGHSLAMLNRIAAALNKRVELRFVSLRGGSGAAKKKRRAA